jgi:hypothetical protein
MRTTLLIGLIAGSGFAVFQMQAANTPEAARDTLGKWVETNQLMSKERSDWKIEASILKDTEQLLSNELLRLTQALEDLNDSATAADQERSQLAEQKEARAAAAQRVQARLGSLEQQLTAILPALPAALVDPIKPLIRRLPSDPAATTLSIGERVQTLVGMLSQAEKFNSTLTITSESRQIKGGPLIEVRTLYWGLAQAYFVDQSGDYAGIGVPTQNGWEWTRVDSAGPEIQRLFEVYAGSAEIQFVAVPARSN